MGTEREAVMRGLPIGPGRILGPGTTWKSEATAVLPDPATGTWGYQRVIRSPPWERLGRHKAGANLWEVFPGRLCHQVRPWEPEGTPVLTTGPWFGEDAYDSPGAEGGKGWKTDE